MSLEEKRKQIRGLLNERSPADAQAIYYAFHHPDDRTQLFTQTDSAENATGYVCLSRTGIDLFKPLLTLRLPSAARGSEPDPESAADLIYSALPTGADLILSAPQEYYPVLSAFFEIQRQQQVRIKILDQERFQPIINVLVTRAETYNGLPRFLLRSSAGPGGTDSSEIAASAGLNWRSDRFAEIYVHTKPAFRKRGFGRSVVAAAVQNTLDNGRIPLYAAGLENEASNRLAESVGFVDTGLVFILLEAVLKPRPF